MKYAIYAALFVSAAATAQAVDVSQSLPEFKAYYLCMTKQAAKYGRKTDRVEDAISAARSACAKSEEGLRDIIAWGEIARGGTDPQRAEDRLMQLIETKIRPDLAKAALDARP